MKRNVSHCNADSSESGSDSEKHHFFKVSDARNQPVRGLWIRNQRYYARLSVEDHQTGQKSVRRVLLKEAKTVPQAVEAMKVLQVERKRGELPVLKRTPKFSEYAEEYLKFYKVVKDAKSESTVKCEEWHLRMWIEHLGDARLDKISRAMINGFIAKRQAQGKSGRTVNLDVVVLRNVLKRAVDDGWIKRLPTENMRPLKWTPKKRRLFTAAEIDNLCAKAPAASKNGAQLANYLRLMATCGSRMTETLRLKWADVNWDRRQLTIGADGRTKNRKSRVVDFNPSLEAHLKDMFARRAPDSEWLFPSPQRGDRDEGSKSFRQSLVQARRLVPSNWRRAAFGYLPRYFEGFRMRSRRSTSCSFSSVFWRRCVADRAMVCGSRQISRAIHAISRRSCRRVFIMCFSWVTDSP